MGGLDRVTQNGPMDNSGSGLGRSPGRFDSLLVDRVPADWLRGGVEQAQHSHAV